MIDRAGRDQLALSVRRLASGRSSVHQFEKQCERSACSDDESLTRIAMALLDAWGFDTLLSLFWLRLAGADRMPARLRRVYARVCLLLRSDEEYGGPDYLPLRHPMPPALLGFGSTVLCEFGCERRAALRAAREVRALGASRLSWPFDSRDRLNTALTSRTYLCGTRDLVRSA